MQTSILVIAAIGQHVIALVLLSFCYSSASSPAGSKAITVPALQKATRLVGIVTGLYTICLPYLLPAQDPIVACAIRVICFFYTCKIVDLVATRAKHPPILLDDAGKANRLSSRIERLLYVWLLLTETRYAAFDIAVQRRGRVPSTTRSGLWTFGPVVIVPALVYMVPAPETQSLLVLLVIQYSLEGLHSLLHPGCPNSLFWQPFAATSLTSFWRTHWHAGADTFLRRLAYEPGNKAASWLGCDDDAARAAGIMLVFNMSGLWHGWATAVLATRPWLVGIRVWGLFMSMGLGILLEGLIPKEKRGSIAQQVCVWTFSMFYAGWAWRSLQRHCKVQWLADL